ncbi:MAG: hypothetical protein NXI31_23420 [bacterium]|nr:hypothetical protein [bacterium]
MAPTPADAVDAVLDALDWTALGAIYFHEDGEAELRGRREAIKDLGLELGKALLRRVPRGGRSLWVGAGLAELPVLLAETMNAGRGVVATNLRVAECELLNSALRRARVGDGLEFLPVDARDECIPGAFDHVGCISLFTDPETWPLLSDVTYGRIAPVQLDVEAFAAERENARSLANRLFEALARPGLVTTSAEEATWFLESATVAGVPYDADEQLIATAVVGDPVGFLRLG